MARPNLTDALGRFLEELPEMEPGCMSYVELAERIGCTLDVAQQIAGELSECESGAWQLPMVVVDAQRAAEVASVLGPERAAETGMDRLAEDGGIIVHEGFGTLSTPLRLDATEARALLDALGRCGISLDGPLATKLRESVLPPDIGQDDLVDYVGRCLDENALKMLSLLCSQRRYAIISYPGPRKVAPLELHTGANGEMYLRAWCPESDGDGMRLFRVSRMEGVEPLAEHYDSGLVWPDSPDSAHELLPAESGTALLEVDREFELDPRVWVGARRTGKAGAAPDSEIVEVPLGSDRTWIARMVLSGMGGIRVVSPTSLAREVERCARELLDAIDELESR